MECPMLKSDFLARYPEFAMTEETAPGLVDACLTEATGELDAVLFGDDFELAEGLFTAVKLVSGPRGRSLKVSAATVARYQAAFDELRLRKTALLRLGNFSG